MAASPSSTVSSSAGSTNLTPLLNVSDAYLRMTSSRRKPIHFLSSFDERTDWERNAEDTLSTLRIMGDGATGRMSEGVDWIVGGDLGVVSVLPKAPFPRLLAEREDANVKVGRMILSRMSCAIFCPGLT